jgi:hypothetical protein
MMSIRFVARRSVSRANAQERRAARLDPTRVSHEA